MAVLKKEDSNLLTYPDVFSISPRVLKLLEKEKISPSSIINMTREEFTAVNRFLRPLVSNEERDTLIKFKLSSMNSDQLKAYDEPTEAEYDEIDSNPDYPKFDISKARFT